MANRVKEDLYRMKWDPEIYPQIKHPLGMKQHLSLDRMMSLMTLMFVGRRQ